MKLLESVALSKLMFMTLDRLLNAHWQRLTSVCTHVEIRSFFLYQNSKTTDVWSNITVLSSQSKTPRVFSSNYVVLGKDTILHFEDSRSLCTFWNGSTWQFFHVKGVDTTDRDPEIAHLTISSSCLWIAMEHMHIHRVSCVRKRPPNTGDALCYQHEAKRSIMFLPQVKAISRVCGFRFPVEYVLLGIAICLIYII